MLPSWHLQLLEMDWSQSLQLLGMVYSLQGFQAVPWGLQLHSRCSLLAAWRCLAHMPKALMRQAGHSLKKKPVRSPLCSSHSFVLAEDLVYCLQHFG